MWPSDDTMFSTPPHMSSSEPSPEVEAAGDRRTGSQCPAEDAPPQDWTDPRVHCEGEDADEAERRNLDVVKWYFIALAVLNRTRTPGFDRVRSLLARHLQPARFHALLSAAETGSLNSENLNGEMLQVIEFDCQVLYDFFFNVELPVFEHVYPQAFQVYKQFFAGRNLPADLLDIVSETLHRMHRMPYKNCIASMLMFLTSHIGAYRRFHPQSEDKDMIF